MISQLIASARLWGSQSWTSVGSMLKKVEAFPEFFSNGIMTEGVGDYRLRRVQPSSYLAVYTRELLVVSLVHHW